MREKLNKKIQNSHRVVYLGIGLFATNVLAASNPIGWFALGAAGVGVLSDVITDWYIDHSQSTVLPSPKQEVDKKYVKLRASITPEDKFGPGGYDAPGTPEGSEKHYVAPGGTFDYRIEFWNKPDASVPTQDAVIEDTLDPNVFDLSTFKFTRFGFLKWDVLLAGGQAINTRVDLRRDMSIAVDVKAII